jgi:ubiquinone/menaquinone biosynthesis C-methylase UbiE
MSESSLVKTGYAPLPAVLGALRAAGEPTRLRLLALLANGELNVTDLTEILGQSQPRISRHLKLMASAGLVERQREGSWAFFRLAHDGPGAALAAAVVSRLSPDETTLIRDRERLAEVRAARAEEAAAYFREHAKDWAKIRTLHVEEAAVEAAIRDAVGAKPVRALLDIGTGTGRIIEIVGAQADRAVGVDLSLDMLAVARANLAKLGLAKAQLRQGDVYALPVQPQSFDLVVIQQVLHFLDEPARAIREAARALAPGGRLLIVDFAPHDLEFLREAHAHRRLGFAPDVVEQWMKQAGLKPELHRDLAPPGGARDKLTVSLWLARDTRVITDLPATDPSRAVA